MQTTPQLQEHVGSSRACIKLAFLSVGVFRDRSNRIGNSFVYRFLNKCFHVSFGSCSLAFLMLVVLPYLDSVCKLRCFEGKKIRSSRLGQRRVAPGWGQAGDPVHGRGRGGGVHCRGPDRGRGVAVDPGRPNAVVAIPFPRPPGLPPLGQVQQLDRPKLPNPAVWRCCRPRGGHLRRW